MPITNDRRSHGRQKDSQRDSKDVISRLGSAEGQSSPIRNDSNTVFYPDSEGRNQARPRVAPGGQATIGGIHRRLKELHQACLSLIESQQKQLETSLQNSKELTTEIYDLQKLLAETLKDIPEEPE
ncbi:hypothetical protein [Nostoc sp. 'Peltigera membranacea cyanobiont' 232]|uniref:hypothetical protein n=1 Tax=Nostoc sp. 'Peltigera membranacea cyanobiont' 232 TaxID=2014531 RepID=UPI000B953BC4|nr:hypothetical protein [Nostoc sp. 'Peltigera membranacea cyanobiont' 232]OYE04738.1 hypothetical protein CDG79_11400 [Nostoc sp. 'Peltigera membranacea cyanobiont' 232]